MTQLKSSTVNPYLTFNGNCYEAMNFYKEVFNANLETMPFEGSPVEVPDDYKQKVLHSTLTFGDAVIMASDTIPGQTLTRGDATSISVNATNISDAELFFKGLSEGGKIIMPFEDTFWGAKFGMCIDKFGVSWMVNCELEQR